MYAQLLMHAVSESVSPQQSYRLSGAVADFKYGFEAEHQGLGYA